jgi:hypothetical protein
MRIEFLTTLPSSTIAVTMHLYFTNRLFQKKNKDQLFFDQQERIDFVGNCLEHVFRPDISALFGVQRKMKVHGLIEREAFWPGLGRVKAGVIVSMEYTDMRKIALLSKLIGTSSSGFEALPILHENRNPQMKWYRYVRIVNGIHILLDV